MDKRMTSDKVTGSMGLENRLNRNAEKVRYDRAGKSVLKHKEILAHILKFSVPEYEEFTVDEIMTFIDADSITDEVAIEPDTDTRICGDDTVQTSENEANLAFDILFKVIEPRKERKGRKNIHLHVDVELQGDYHPGYPIEKRGIYNLARMTSSQLEVVTKKSNYDSLEKSYCIFICVGNVPQYLWNTVSYYEFANTKNIGNVENNLKDFDLMGLVIIRIGAKTLEGVTEIVQFLHALFFDTKRIEEYIDFSQNEKFREELSNMSITGEHLIQLGEQRSQEKVIELEERLKSKDEQLKVTKEQVESINDELKKERARNDELEERIKKLEGHILK